ncbi:unnamed protein product [Mytilus edulis]|uniref:Uncharacterized protein n=1 Tax=Mytilus edulis TaxID=6550 RepID=A0A8S3UCI0_MYTED|nr:unnamed protein product [Mytilus edulis]
MIGTLEHVDLVSQEQETNRDKTQGNLPEHLKELVEKCSSSLTLENKQKLIELLVEYQDIFVGPDGMLGQTDVVKHKINTGSAKPVKTPPRRISPKQKEIVEKELESMLKKGVIEPSNSSWSSPICLVKKKDQVSWRFCIDYRRVNSLCSPSGYPLQKIDDCLASLEGAKWLSTVDCHSGYWQVSCDEDREKLLLALIKFRKGTQHSNADGLSRIPARKCKKMIVNSVSQIPLSKVRLRKMQTAGSVIGFTQGAVLQS